MRLVGFSILLPSFRSKRARPIKPCAGHRRRRVDLNRDRQIELFDVSPASIRQLHVAKSLPKELGRTLHRDAVPPGAPERHGAAN